MKKKSNKVTAPTLADPKEMLDFTQGILIGIQEAVAKTKGFSPVAFVVATRDPQSKADYDSPKAVPISIDLLFEAAGPGVADEIKSLYDDPLELFLETVRISSEQGRAIGLIMVTSGIATEVEVDPKTKEPSGGSIDTEAVLVVMQHIRCPTKAWLARLNIEADNIVALEDFEELTTIPDVGIAKGLLPLWN